MVGMSVAVSRRMFQRVSDRGAPPAVVPDAAPPVGTALAPDTSSPAAPGEVGAERPGWAEIVATHSPRVYRLAYRLTGNAHDAEDLTQDVFVRVFRSLDSFVPGNFEAWLHRITTNLFLDGARRRQRIRFDALSDDAGALLADAGPGPVERFDMTHLDGDVRAALLDLKPEFRAAVVLCDIEGLPYEEVAAVLGVKLGTVRSRIHRGRTQLRERLAHRAPGGGSELDRPTPGPTPAPGSTPRGGGRLAVGRRARPV